MDKENLATNKDPRRLGKSLKGKMKGLWRYRIGDHRIVSQIQDENILILIVRIGQRGGIYKNK